MLGFSFAGSSSNAGMMFVNTSAMPGDHRKRQSTAQILKSVAPKLQMLMLGKMG